MRGEVLLQTLGVKTLDKRVKSIAACLRPKKRASWEARTVQRKLARKTFSAAFCFGSLKLFGISDMIKKL